MSATAVLGRPTETQRAALYRRFESRISPNPALDRTLVSFQANKRAPFFGWLKYKEGFSAPLVRYVLDTQTARPGTLLDPFAGVGTALFVARATGWDALGIELMPIGCFLADARDTIERLKPETIRRHIAGVLDVAWEALYDKAFAFPHVAITEGAFPPATERSLAGYRAYCAKHLRRSPVRKLFEVAALSVLEQISYTSKDGQYLRWDHRARKPRSSSRFDKGVIEDFNTAIRRRLRSILRDLESRSEALPFAATQDAPETRLGRVNLRRGSCLEILPTLPSSTVDLVMTSPPYCNRYDYTRTYALELAYQGLGAEGIKSLRQQLLSCTVENRAKTDWLRHEYERRGERPAFERVSTTYARQAALSEVLELLRAKARSGKLNNANIPPMVANYFFEMALVICELARLLRPGGKVVMVNDNVRYAGEEVPVDLILSSFAESFGLRVDHIWTLARGKGNSSQQMGKHGRHELRKCVYVWRRPPAQNLSSSRAQRCF